MSSKNYGRHISGSRSYRDNWQWGFTSTLFHMTWSDLALLLTSQITWNRTGTTLRSSFLTMHYQIWSQSLLSRRGCKLFLIPFPTSSWNMQLCTWGEREICRLWKHCTVGVSWRRHNFRQKSFVWAKKSIFFRSKNTSKDELLHHKCITRIAGITVDFVKASRCHFRFEPI